MAKGQRWEDLTMALTLGRDPSSYEEAGPDGEPPLQLVAAAGNAAMVKRCIDYGALVNASDAQKRFLTSCSHPPLIKGCPSFDVLMISNSAEHLSTLLLFTRETLLPLKLC